MKPIRRPLSSLCAALPLLAATLLGACKGSSAAGGDAGGAQNALMGGGSAPGAAGAGQRTDLAPELTVVEELTVRAERELEVAQAGGDPLRIVEVLHADGPDRLALEVAAVWDPVTQAWIQPHPVLAALYAERASYLVKLRDLHLHERGLYANYRWEPQPGTVTMAGRICMTTRAVSLHGHGPVDLVHELGTGLLLGWTVWDASGTTPLMRLTTTSLDEKPNLAGVAWADDREPESLYDPEIHDPLLHIAPRAVSYPPAGFYREKEVVMDVQGQLAGVGFVHLSYWTDGLRTLFVMQHEWSAGQGNGEFNVARISREGGIVAAETDCPDRRVGAVGMLPDDELLMVLGGLKQ